MIDREDYEVWRAHPVTEAVVRALQMLAEANKQKWIEMSWEGGQSDQSALIELRTRYETAMDLAELTVEELNGIIEDEK